MRALTLGAVLVAAAAHAEEGWLANEGRISKRSELTVFAGLHSVGVGAVRPDAVVEGAWGFTDRVLTLSATRRWAWKETGRARLAATAGLSGYLVPDLALDLGLGPHVGLGLSLGGEAFSVALGGTSGVEVFARGAARFTERLQLGLHGRFGRVSVGLVGRVGVDLAPGRNFAVVTDAIVRVGLLAE